MSKLDCGDGMDPRLGSKRRQVNGPGPSGLSDPVLRSEQYEVGVQFGEFFQGDDQTDE